MSLMNILYIFAALTVYINAQIEDFDSYEPNYDYNIGPNHEILYDANEVLKNWIRVNEIAIAALHGNYAGRKHVQLLTIANEHLAPLFGVKFHQHDKLDDGFNNNVEHPQTPGHGKLDQHIYDKFKGFHPELVTITPKSGLANINIDN
ncbi:hypothetical protein ABEB36_006743 [Hypothenemus hampei]|uniref:Uncharacterized protein n=1 Tax=Hypothenemus hampei TaxID=57062 RepID=A0ABD1ERL3_HYPHA